MLCHPIPAAVLAVAGVSAAAQAAADMAAVAVAAVNQKHSHHFLRFVLQNATMKVS